MKTILCFALLVAFAYSRPSATEKQSQAECEAQTGISEQMLNDARKGQVEDVAKLAQHLFCVSRKEGLQTADGKIQMDALRARLLEENPDAAAVDAALAKCATEHESPEQTAFFVAKCLYGGGK